MRSPSTESSSGQSGSGNHRISDVLSERQDSYDDELIGRGMLPVFLADQSDLIEVMLEIDEDSNVVRRVTTAPATPVQSETDRLSRSLSAASLFRKSFSWLRSPSPRPPSSCGRVEDAAMDARDARRAQARLTRTRSGAQRALKGLRFISHATGSAQAAELWRRVERRFDSLSHDGLLHRDHFGECIGMGDSKEFAGGLFDALTRRRRQRMERITKEELYELWVQISDQSFDARLQIFFDMVDANIDGRITREEVQELINLSASANKLSKLKEQAAEYAALIMEELDPENLGYIELWQLEALLLQREFYMSGGSRQLSAQGWSQGIVGGGAKRRWSCVGLRQALRRAEVAASEGWRRAWVVLLWCAAMAGLFAWKFVQYRRSHAFEVLGHCLPVAKGAAETLKLNMALILLPVCRNTLTWLRSTKARLFVPFDDNISFHKVIATAIVAGVVVHAGTHLSCDFPRVVRSSPEKYTVIAGDFGENRPTYGSLLIGVEGLTGIAMVVLMGISFMLATHWFRKEGVRLPSPLNKLTGFNAFWYSHHLLAVVYGLLLVHGYFMYLVHKWYERTIWMYISVPLFLYIGERTLRTFRSKAYSVKILKVSALPGNVLILIMSRPHGFRYKSGQYIFLKCPMISPFEWHPFSITSAPGDDHLSVHIRTSGDWTQELKRIFAEKYLSSCGMGRPGHQEAPADQKSLPRLLVDGPYGAPAQDYRNYDVLLLVGLGIGATPFVSILRDLLNNIKTAEELIMDSTTEISKSNESINSLNFPSGRKKPQKTSNAHFYWVTREAGSFEWFKGVMDEVADMDQKGIIEMHNYLTSVYEEGDARTTLLTMVQALNHAKHGVDIVSGTRVRTHFARPSWKEVFARIASKHPGATVGVFYCGTPVLGKELRRLSHELSHRTSTRFDFHKEYF